MQVPADLEAYLATPSPLAFECPLCHAEPGHGCINTASGKTFAGFTHRERRQEARRGV